MTCRAFVPVFAASRCILSYLSHTISPSTTAASVVAISRVRREKRLKGSQGIAASDPITVIENQSGMNTVQLIGGPG